MILLQRQSKKKYSDRLLTCLCSLFIFTYTGCYIDKEELLYPGSTTPADCTIVAAKFTTDILPLIKSKCAVSGCHDASASGGVILLTYLQISSKKERINLRAVVEKTMPAAGSLSPTEVSKMKCWIDGGAINN